MKRIVLKNEDHMRIDHSKPTGVESTVKLQEPAGKVLRLEVMINITHSYTDDLDISLVSPDKKEVILVSREGGSGDNFLDTIFDADSRSSIVGARAPFQGAFRPEGSLDDFKGIDPAGAWTLKIKDKAAMDGGSLNYWTLTLMTEDDVQSEFSIDIRFMGGLTPGQQDVVMAAAQRWSEIIVGDLPAYLVEGEPVDDMLIDFSGEDIDGPLGVLGQAGPTHIRPGSGIPIKGIAMFDIGDLARMESNGSLLGVIVHEIAHILGYGTIWQDLGLLAGADTANPVFLGKNAMREFKALAGLSHQKPVPVANRGGRGTRDAHWREGIFGNELMTGYVNPGINPLSRLTIASFEDLGFEVNYDVCDPYELPGPRVLSIMGIGAEGGYGRRQCAMAGLNMARTSPIVLSESDRV